MNLTEYELADLAMSVQSSTTPAVAVFVTIMGAYLLVAWLAGGKLTRAQVSLINVLFIFFQLTMVLSWGLRWEHAYRFMGALASLDPTFYIPVYPVLLATFAIVMLATIPGCIRFMWDVRHPKAE